jgi:hypothetical protein
MSAPLLLKGLTLACVFGWLQGVAYAQLQTFAIQGEDSPVAGSLYQDFNPPAVSDADGGSLAFIALVKNGKKKKCIFRLGDTTDSPVACTLDPSPSPGTPLYRRLNDVNINTAGTVAWQAILKGQFSGIYRAPLGGAVSTVAYEGDQVKVTGTNGGFLNELGLVAIADNGDVAFQSTLIPPGSVSALRTDGLFICSGGGHCSATANALNTTVARNSLIPDPNDLITADLRFCTFTRLAASNYGIAFFAGTKVDCTNSGEDFVTGVFRWHSATSTLETLALEGRDALPGGSKYNEIGGFLNMNNSGTVAFKSSTRQNFALEDVLYVCDTTCAVKTGGTLAQVAVKVGDSDGNGNTIRNISSPNIDDAGNIAFSAESKDPITKQTISGVYKKVGGVIQTLALKGLTAVPAPADADSFVSLFDKRISMSASGKVGFKARVSGPYPIAKPDRKVGVFLFE